MAYSSSKIAFKTNLKWSLTYLALGDKGSALKQYNALKHIDENNKANPWIAGLSD
jgi:hypothetical protein